MKDPVREKLKKMLTENKDLDQFIVRLEQRGYQIVINVGTVPDDGSDVYKMLLTKVGDLEIEFSGPVSTTLSGAARGLVDALRTMAAVVVDADPSKLGPDGILLSDMSN